MKNIFNFFYIKNFFFSSYTLQFEGKIFIYIPARSITDGKDKKYKRPKLTLTRLNVSFDANINIEFLVDFEIKRNIK